MKVDIQIDRTCTEPVVVIRTAEVTDEVRRAVEILADLSSPAVLAGFRGGAACVLQPEDIVRVYAAGGKVYAATRTGDYTLRMRLYETEKRLPKNRFVRISKSEIVNLQEVAKFDLSMSGTIMVLLKDGTTSFVSRRYVPQVRDVLGI